jgi:hypothetical protein
VTSDPQGAKNDDHQDKLNEHRHGREEIHPALVPIWAEEMMTTVQQINREIKGTQ